MAGHASACVLRAWFFAVTRQKMCTDFFVGTGTRGGPKNWIFHFAMLPHISQNRYILAYNLRRKYKKQKRGDRGVINVNFEGKLAVISFAVDHVDSSNYKKFKYLMQPYITEGAKFIFNIEALKFIDSSGLGAFLSILRDLHKLNGEMVICGASAAVKILFDLVHLSKVIQIFPDKEQAEQALV
jgi:anti-sigma B factor antagonist